MLGASPSTYSPTPVSDEDAQAELMNLKMLLGASSSTYSPYPIDL